MWNDFMLIISYNEAVWMCFMYKLKDKHELRWDRFATCTYLIKQFCIEKLYFDSFDLKIHWDHRCSCLCTHHDRYSGLRLSQKSLKWYIFANILLSRDILSWHKLSLDNNTSKRIHTVKQLVQKRQEFGEHSHTCTRKQEAIFSTT